MKLSGWGLFPVVDSKISTPTSIDFLKKEISSKSSIARGNGRSYGDSAISSQNTIDMKKFNKIISFDNNKGLLVVEAGFLLADLLKIFIPKGWFPYVTPGTKFLTIGGMVASNVHGKNHHIDGSFSNFIEWIDLIDVSGKEVRCSKNKNKELFNWTVGGMGLTGIILRVSFFLRSIESSYLKTNTIICDNLKKTIKTLEDNINHTYSVAWLDSTSKNHYFGRSVVMLGEHATDLDVQKLNLNNNFPIFNNQKYSIPFNIPFNIFRYSIIKIFNSLYFNFLKLKSGPKITNYNKFFYPLDGIKNWNKAYGTKGFFQFQCVFPIENSIAGITDILKILSKNKVGSFLTVVKRLKDDDTNFSFPMNGYTISLDIPVSDSNHKIMKILDSVVIKYHGRIYLAKDGRILCSDYISIDKRYFSYKKFREANLMNVYFSSEQSKRLKL